MELGFVGLGHMGSQMVTHLIEKGHSVTAFDLRPEAMESIAGVGARTAPSVAALCAELDFLLLSLPDHRASEKVIMGPGGVLASPRKPNTLVVDFSTGHPDAHRRIHAAAKEAGVAYLDAPVSGGPMGSRKGTLSIMIGGDQEVAERAMPVLRDMGSQIFYMEPSWVGSAAKPINNMLNTVCLVASIEGVTLGAKLGMDLKTLYNLVRVSSGRSRAFERRVPVIYTRDFAPSFSLELAYKDVSLATQLAEENGVPVPVANMAKQIAAMGMQLGLGAEDHSVLVKVYEMFAKVEVNVPDFQP